MPLIKPVLEAQILFALQRVSTTSTSLQDSQIQLASALADAIDAYVRSATVIVPPGQTVTGVAGTVPVVGSTVTPTTATIT